MSETLISAGTVLAPDGKRIRDGAVLVRDREIVNVGPLAEVQKGASGEAEVFDYPKSSTLLPGLIDAHVRLTLSGGKTPYQEFQEVDLTTESRQRTYRENVMARRAQATLSVGVTTVRDVGDSRGLAVRLGKQIADGEIGGPRIIAAGVPLTTRGGDGSFLGGEVDTDDSIREAVAAHAEAGADLICYHDSGGFLKLVPRTPPFSWETQFKPAQVELIVSEARKHGLPVAAHVFSKDGIAHAVDAGVDTIEHCYWTVGREQYDREESVAAAMAERGIIACLPSNANREHMIERVGEERARELWYGRFPWLDEIGVRLAAGSSAGSTTSPFDDFVGCLETYEWIGFSREKIIQFATRNAASALGLDKVTGTLEAGYSADLLVVDGNPLEDLQALRRPQFVMVAGRIAGSAG